jgi:hypothetical protein
MFRAGCRRGRHLLFGSRDAPVIRTAESVRVISAEFTDGVILLRPLHMNDAADYLAHEDEAIAAAKRRTQQKRNRADLH